MTGGSQRPVVCVSSSGSSWLHGCDVAVGEESVTEEHVADLVRSAPPGYTPHAPIRMTLTQLRALGSCVLGWQVLVQSREGSFVGYICWMLEHCDRLGLEQACRPGSEVRRVGLLLLYYRVISSVTLLAKRKIDPRHASIQRRNILKETKGRTLHMKKVVPPHLEDMSQSEQDDQEEEEQPAPPLPAPAGRLSRPNSWTVIDSLDDTFAAAMSEMAGSGRVGLSYWGHRVGRWGALAWICVATDHNIFLLDVASIGLSRLMFGEKHSKKQSKKSAQAVRNDVENDERVLSNAVTNGAEKDVAKSVAIDAATASKSLETIRNLLQKVTEKSAESDVQNGTNLLQSTSINNETSADDGKDNCVENNGNIDSSVLESNVFGNEYSPPAAPTIAAVSQISPNSADSNTIDVTKCPSQTDITNQCPPEGNQKDLPVCSQQECIDDPMYLADVLRDPLVEVVIHDSRNLCDMLHHQLGLRIATLYDTQASEVYLYQLLHKGQCPAFVSSLGPLLTRRLQLHPLHLLYERQLSPRNSDPSALFERPLSGRVMAGLASSCMFLCELRQQQLYEALADLRQMTAVHADAYTLRDDITRARVEAYVVPAAVQQLCRRTVLNCLQRSVAVARNTAR